MEKYVIPTPNAHGTGGPIAVGFGKEWQPLVPHCLNGALEAGYKLNTDHNDGNCTGIAIAQMNVDNGIRRSSAAAFLSAAERGRLDNLVVVTKTICQRVLFSGKRASGVQLLPARPGDSCSPFEPVGVNAKEEIVLTAGTFETPHILMLSGIGPKDELNRHNISVVEDLPSVGQNIRDHCAFSIECVIDPSITGHNQLLRNPEALAMAQEEYKKSHTGPLAVFGASAAVLFARIPKLFDTSDFAALSPREQAFIREPDRPSTEIWMHGGPLFYPGPVDAEDSIIALEGLCQNLLSRGSLRLQSADPRSLPKVDPAYLSAPYDWQIAIETVKLLLSLTKSPALARIIRQPLHGPGKRDADGKLTLADEDDDETIRVYLRENLTQGFHSMGSCVMGNEANKDRVVDAKFSVVGLQGLRLADMSVCPILTTNHTQINAYLIAEHCAQVMLDRSKGRMVASRL